MFGFFALAVAVLLRIYRRNLNGAPICTATKPDDDDVALLLMANCPDQSPPLPGRKFCGTCGQKHDGPVAFCPGCGVAGSGVDGDGDDDTIPLVLLPAAAPVATPGTTPATS